MAAALIAGNEAPASDQLPDLTLTAVGNDASRVPSPERGVKSSETYAEPDAINDSINVDFPEPLAPASKTPRRS